MRSRCASRFGLACFAVMALALGGCGLTRSSTRAVDTGPPGTTGQAATSTPQAASWSDTCGPAPMLPMTTITGWAASPSVCYDRKPGLDANGKEHPPVLRPGGLEFFKGQHGPLVLRLNGPKNGMTGKTKLVAVADWQGAALCFAAFKAGSYAPGTTPTATVMTCAGDGATGSSVEFPKRWLQSLECDGGDSCNYDLMVVCQQAPCRLGSVGIMYRPKEGPG